MGNHGGDEGLRNFFPRMGSETLNEGSRDFEPQIHDGWAPVGSESYLTEGGALPVLHGFRFIAAFAR